MARRIINLGTADKGNGDPIRTAFGKINDNFAELYAILAGGGGAQIIESDIRGSVFGDDSTLIVDGVNGTLHGRLIGDVEGSVFADDSTKIIDGILGKVVGPIQTSVTNVSITGGTNGQVLSTNGSGVLSWTTLSSTTDRLSNSGDEVVLFGGTNPYTLFPAITGGDQLQIQGAEVSSVSGHLALTSQNNLYIIANGSGAAPGGSKSWTFGDNGSLTFPDSTVQTTAYTGGGATIVSAPAHQYGQAGDTAGLLAYDNEYFYWCFQNYVDNSTACWRRVARSLTSW